MLSVTFEQEKPNVYVAESFSIGTLSQYGVLQYHELSVVSIFGCFWKSLGLLLPSGRPTHNLLILRGDRGQMGPLQFSEIWKHVNVYQTHTVKVWVICSWLGPMSSSSSTWQGPSVSAFLEATHEASWGPLKGPLSFVSYKSPSKPF